MSPPQAQARCRRRRRGPASRGSRPAAAALLLAAAAVAVVALAAAPTAQAETFSEAAMALAKRGAAQLGNQMRSRAAAARESSQGGGGGGGQGPLEFKPPVVRPIDLGGEYQGGGGGGGGYNGGGGGGCRGGCCNGGCGGGGGAGAFFAGVNAGSLVGLAGSGVNAYVDLTAPIVTDIGSKFPVSVPAVFADGTTCKFGQPFYDPQGRLMCQLTDMGRVANYGYRVLGVATNLGVQAANAFIGGRRRLQERRPEAGDARHEGEAPLLPSSPSSPPALSAADLAAQQALLAQIPLPSWAR